MKYRPFLPGRFHIRLIHVLVGLVLLSVVGTSAIQTAAGIRSEKQSLTAATLSANYERAVSLSGTMNTLIDSMQKSLSAAADQLAAAGMSDPQEEAGRLLKSSSLFNSVIVVNRSGVITGNAPLSLGLTGKPITTKIAKTALALKRPYVSKPYIARTGRLIMLITQPLFDREGVCHGFIGGTIYLQEKNVLTDIFGTHLSSENGSYFYVVDQNGNLIFHPDTRRIGENLKGIHAVSQATAGHSGSSSVADEKEFPYLAGYANVPINGWGIVVQTPSAIVDQAAYRLIKKQFTYSLPLILLLLLVTLYVARMLSMPFARLTEAVQKIARGERVSNPAGTRSWNYEAFHLSKTVMLAVRSLQRKADRYSAEAQTDALTGLMNRRAMVGCSDCWIESGIPFAIMVLDIDHFKTINDTFGHQTGDDVLKSVAKLLISETRQSDIRCRYGGEEFVILLPQTSLEDARDLAEHIRGKIAALQIPTGREVTVSIGIASVPDHGADFVDAFHHADLSLYEAKRNGRNQTVVYPEKKRPV